MNVSPFWGVFASLVYAGIGYTLLTYSLDGDLSLRTKSQGTKYADPRISSEEESWERLRLLANANATEVTWNTSMFVALVSSLVCVSLVSYANSQYNSASGLNTTTTGIVWLISLSTVFIMQDIIERWKSAHRKHAVASEQEAIINRLRSEKSPKSSLK